MQGGPRDFVVLRTAVAIACAALIAMIAAPAAFAGSPATDQYGSAIPGGGGGNTSGSSPSGGSGTTIPGAPAASSSGQATGSSSDSGGTNSGGTTKADSTGSHCGSPPGAPHSH